MLALISCLCAAVSLQDPLTLDATQFSRLVEAQSTALRDIAFIYEGELRWVGSKSVLGGDVETFGNQFQGAYLYRRNDAALVDIYLKSKLATSGTNRLKMSLLRGTLESLRLVADAKRRPQLEPLNQKRSGSFGSFGGPASPNVLFSPWKLLSLAEEHAADFHALSWDPVQGHKCFRFRLGDKASDAGSYEDYWVDLERSANILKTETYKKAKLVSRIDDVHLLKVSTPDGQAYWLPVRARMQGFEWNDKTYGSAIMEEIIEVVDGSILLNQGLPDAIFSVRRDAGLPAPGELESLRKVASLRLGQEFDATPEAPSDRIDPAGARERLDKNLAEADKQAKMLEASAPSRESWTWVGASQLMLVVACVALVGGALALRRRS